MTLPLGWTVNVNAPFAATESGKAFDEDLPVCEDYDLWLRVTAIFHDEGLVEIENGIARRHPQP